MKKWDPNFSHAIVIVSNSEGMGVTFLLIWVQLREKLKKKEKYFTTSTY